MDPKEISNRLEALEKSHKEFQDAYYQDFEKITKLLNVIHNRLIGSIENDSVGLINEVKKQKEENHTNLEQNQINSKKLEEISLQIANLKSECASLDKIREELDKLKNIKLIGYGVAIVVGYIASHLGDFVGFLKKIAG